MHQSNFALASALALVVGCAADPEPRFLDGPVNESLEPEDAARWRTIESDCTTAFERVGIWAEDVVASTTAGFDDTDVGCGDGGGVFVRGHDGQAFVCALSVLVGPPPMEGDPLPSDYAEASLVLGRLDLETGEIDSLAYDGGSTDMDPATVTIEAEGPDIRCRAEGEGEVYEASFQDPDPAPGTSGLVEDRVAGVTDLALRPAE